MQGRKTKLTVTLSPDERSILESWQRSTLISAGLARRGLAILMLADGASISGIKRRTGLTRSHIYQWINRFQAERVQGLHDKPGRGRKPFFPSGSCRPRR